MNYTDIGGYLITGTQSIPKNENNKDYQRVLKEVIAGTSTIEPYVEPEVNHTAASKLLVIRALKDSGDWDSIRTVIYSTQETEDEWLAASELYIDDPLIQSMLPSIGWSQEQLQALFNEVNT